MQNIVRPNPFYVNIAFHIETGKQMADLYIYEMQHLAEMS